jgi:Ca2+-dependent lipid-binding protein
MRVCAVCACFHVFFNGQNRERTKTKKSTSAPVWNANYFFYIPPEQASATFDVDLYDWSLLGPYHQPLPPLLPYHTIPHHIIPPHTTRAHRVARVT